MDELSVDLILLATRPSGNLPAHDKLGFGLSGSELVRLVAARRADIKGGRIVVLSQAPTGDPLLDQALASMTGGRRAPTAKAWVARRRSRHLEGYQAQMAADGILHAERYKFLGFIPAIRWTVTDTARAARARSRLEAVAASAGPVQPAQAALAGLATATGLASEIFPGWSGRAARKRLKQAGRSDLAAAGASRAAAGAQATNESELDAVNEALTSAIDSVIQAAVHAATEATHHAAHSSGHSGGHGGGGGHH